MWKYVLGFLVFAGLGVWLLMRGGGDIDLSGEKHEVHVPAAVEAPKK
jgi:hypothetical protein